MQRVVSSRGGCSTREPPPQFKGEQCRDATSCVNHEQAKSAERARRVVRIAARARHRYPARLCRGRGRSAGTPPSVGGDGRSLRAAHTNAHALERTLVLLKPDAVQRGLVGEILSRLEKKGLKLVGIQLRQFPRKLIEEHYSVHKERPFYPKLVQFMTSGPVLAVAVEGKEAIEVVRKLMGKTNSRQAEPGTIRGDLGMSFSNNLVHGSDSAEAAKKELALFFSDPASLCDWKQPALEWIYSVQEEL